MRSLARSPGGTESRSKMSRAPRICSLARAGGSGQPKSARTVERLVRTRGSGCTLKLLACVARVRPRVPDRADGDGGAYAQCVSDPSSVPTQRASFAKRDPQGGSWHCGARVPPGWALKSRCEVDCMAPTCSRGSGPRAKCEALRKSSRDIGHGSGATAAIAGQGATCEGAEIRELSKCPPEDNAAFYSFLCSRHGAIGAGDIVKKTGAAPVPAPRESRDLSSFI